MCIYLHSYSEEEVEMVIKNKPILIIAFLITLLIFISIYFSNLLLHKEREDVIEERMAAFIENYQDVQTLSLMSDVFGEEVTCLAMEAQVLSMNNELWETGTKIDQYRARTEEFMDDPFFLEQKKIFNRNEVLYFSMIKGMEEWCEVNQTSILFFYKKKEECVDCDAQAFVLTDIKHELGNEVAIFSFDQDVALAPVAILAEYYNVTTYPCTVIGEETYCGVYSKEEILKILCQEKDFSICPKEETELMSDG